MTVLRLYCIRWLDLHGMGRFMVLLDMFWGLHCNRLWLCDYYFFNLFRFFLECCHRPALDDVDLLGLDRPFNVLRTVIMRFYLLCDACEFLNLPVGEYLQLVLS